MEFEIDKCLNKSRKELENIFLMALRKAAPKYFEINYSKNEVLGIGRVAQPLSNPISIDLTSLACKCTISDEIIYSSQIDIARFTLGYFVDEITTHDINCYFAIGDRKHALYVSKPTISVERSFFFPTTINMYLRVRAAMIIFVKSLDKIPISNKLKAIVELESNGYYKTKISIKEAERLCYEIASNR